MNTATLTYTINAPSFEAFKEEVIKLYTQLVGIERLAAAPVADGKPAVSLVDPPKVQPPVTFAERVAAAAPPAADERAAAADTAPPTSAKRGRKSNAEKAAAAAAPPKDRIFAEEAAPVTAAETLKAPEPPHYTDDMPTPDLYLRLRAHAKEFHDEHGPEKLKAIYAQHGVEGVSKIENDREKQLAVLKHLDNLLGTDPETGVIPPVTGDTDDLL